MDLNALFISKSFHLIKINRNLVIDKKYAIVNANKSFLTYVNQLLNYYLFSTVYRLNLTYL